MMQWLEKVEVQCSFVHAKLCSIVCACSCALSLKHITAAFQCPELFDVPNGEVELSGRTPGSTATYTCNFGFVLQGDSQRVCMENETWSGQPPTCFRKLISHSNYSIPTL